MPLRLLGRLPLCAHRVHNRDSGPKVVSVFVFFVSRSIKYDAADPLERCRKVEQMPSV